MLGSVSNLNETIIPSGDHPSTKFFKNLGTGSKSTTNRLLLGTLGEESKLSKVSSSTTPDPDPLPEPGAGVALVLALGVAAFEVAVEADFLYSATASVLWILCSLMRSGGTKKSLTAAAR